jgi:ZIP family zinc transporter
LGAAVVFVRRQTPLRKVHLAGALSMAGSVMMTVSVTSLLPEALTGEDTASWLPLDSTAMGQRLLSVSAGSLLYYALSKCAFPEPDVILGWNEESSAADDTEQVALLEQRTSKQPTSLRIRSQVSLTSRDEGVEGLPAPLSPRATEKATEKSASAGTTSTSWWSVYSSGQDLASDDARRAWRVTWLLFVSLAVHNFPEGLAVAASNLHSPHLGWTTAVAIGLHNIPEGIAIAVPCLAARPDAPYLAFWLASLSGLTEPLGALVALVILPHNGDASSQDMGNILALVASIMMAVAVGELFPEAWRNAVAEKDGRKWFVGGSLLGCFIMLGSEAALEP